MTCSTESIAQKSMAASFYSNSRKLSTFHRRNSIKPRNHADLWVRARPRLDLVAKKVSPPDAPSSLCFCAFPLWIRTHFFYRN